MSTGNDKQQKCDGNHGGPRCGDPGCWNDEYMPAGIIGAILNDAEVDAVGMAVDSLSTISQLREERDSFQRVGIDALAALAERDAELERLRAKTTTTMGVGSGDGRLFIHGDYESVKAAQGIVIERDMLRGTVDLLNARVAELDAWKAQEMQLMSPLMDYARGVCTGPLGCSLADWLVQDHKRLIAELARVTQADAHYQTEALRLNAELAACVSDGLSVGMSQDEAGEFAARLNATPVQQVSVPDERAAFEVQFPLEDGVEWNEADQRYEAFTAFDRSRQHAVDWQNSMLEVWQARAMLAAAPAPAADAGLVDEQAEFESWITQEAGPDAAKRWPTATGPCYENYRVQDYRTGWVECIRRMALAAQRPVAPAPGGE